MNYASTNEPENHEPMTILDPQGMAASVSDYMQSDEFKRKLAVKQENKMSNEIGTREHYEEYARDCENAGIMPVSWASWEIQYPQPIKGLAHAFDVQEQVASAPAGVDDTFHAKLIAGASSVTPVYTPERIAALEAENARLQSELDAAREQEAEVKAQELTIEDMLNAFIEIRQ